MRDCSSQYVLFFPVKSKKNRAKLPIFHGNYTLFSVMPKLSIIYVSRLALQIFSRMFFFFSDEILRENERSCTEAVETYCELVQERPLYPKYLS